MKKIKESRAASFVAVGIIYALATAVGIICYKAMPFEFWLSLLLADIIATVFTFIFSLIFKNASVYDPYWSVQPPVIVLAFAIGKNLTPARVLLILAILFWAIRLTANWAYTFHGLNHQDWRYTMLHEKCGRWYPVINFIGIHTVPTLIVWAATLPAVFAFVYDTEKIGVLGILGFLLSLFAATLQLISDIQMHKYRRTRVTPFIRTGLWHNSRHPNYLGEILMWWGVGILAVSVMPERWYLLAGALANTLLFLFVSIPMADERQSGKEGFAEYKQKTRMLLPIPKLK